MCIEIAFANLKGLGISDLAILRLKNSVNTDKIIGAASFKNMWLIQSDTEVFVISSCVNYFSTSNKLDFKILVLKFRVISCFEPIKMYI